MSVGLSFTDTVYTLLGREGFAPRGGDETKDMPATWGGGPDPLAAESSYLGGGSDPPSSRTQLPGGGGQPAWPRRMDLSVSSKICVTV